MNFIFYANALCLCYVYYMQATNLLHFIRHQLNNNIIIKILNFNIINFILKKFLIYILIIIELINIC